MHGNGQFYGSKIGCEVPARFGNGGNQKRSDFLTERRTLRIGQLFQILRSMQMIQKVILCHSLFFCIHTSIGVVVQSPPSPHFFLSSNSFVRSNRTACSGNGCNASIASCVKRFASSRAASSPSSVTNVCLCSSASLPTGFPSTSVVLVTSRISSTIWKASPRQAP